MVWGEVGAEEREAGILEKAQTLKATQALNQISVQPLKNLDLGQVSYSLYPSVPSSEMGIATVFTSLGYSMD